MNTNQNPFNQTGKKPKRIQHTNFVEALKSIGTSTVSSLKDDVIAGTAKDAIQSITSPSQSQSYENNQSQNQEIPDWLVKQEQERKHEQKLREQHKSLTELTPVFDSQQEKVKAEIKALREELALLAKDLGKLGHNVQKAIDEEISSPGTYHVNYFQKLKKFIIHLRKQVSESSNWLEISSHRKSSQRHYWGNVKKSGTKYMLSHDRAVATQTG